MLGRRFFAFCTRTPKFIHFSPSSNFINVFLPKYKYCTIQNNQDQQEEINDQIEEDKITENTQYSTQPTNYIERFIPSEINPIANSDVTKRSKFERDYFIRLDKLLSNLGLTTRSKAIKFIRQNKITVVTGYKEYDQIINDENEQPKTVTFREEVHKIVRYDDIIYPPAVRMNSTPLEFVNKFFFFFKLFFGFLKIKFVKSGKRLSIVLHKPPGYVCTHAREDPESKIVFDLLPVRSPSFLPFHPLSFTPSH